MRPELLRTGAWSGEVLVKVAGGGAIPMFVSTTAKIGPGGETNGGVVYARELSRLDTAVVADLADLADVDEVTGLLTRAAFDDRVRRLRSRRHGVTANPARWCSSRSSA